MHKQTQEIAEFPFDRDDAMGRELTKAMFENYAPAPRPKTTRWKSAYHPIPDEELDAVRAMAKPQRRDWLRTRTAKQRKKNERKRQRQARRANR